MTPDGLSISAPSVGSCTSLDQLPDEVQVLIVSYTTSSSCPGPVLLACVNKTWAAAAGRTLEVEGANISLSIHSDAHTPGVTIAQQPQRLASLAMWLNRWGHLITELTTQLTGGGLWHTSKVTIPAIVEALAAAAARQPGGLRLQQLRVPSVGTTPLATVCAVLAACPLLRELRLDQKWTGADQPAAQVTCPQLPATLTALTRLTHLHLHGSLLGVRTALKREVRGEAWHQLVSHLPTSLAVLVIAEADQLDLPASSLAHLQSLQQLVLPAGLRLRSGGEASALAALSALTSMTYPNAMLPMDRGEGGERHHPALHPPNLVTLAARQCAGPCWQQLVGVASATLRHLACSVNPASGAAQGPQLVQLVQLTRLDLDTESPTWSDEPDAGVQGWCDAIAGLPRLRHLAIPGTFLCQLDVAPFTRLTRLEVAVANPRYRGVVVYSQPRVVELLQRLGPLAGHSLQVVALVGGAGEWRDACAAALAEVVGGGVALEVC